MPFSVILKNPTLSPIVYFAPRKRGGIPGPGNIQYSENGSIES